MRAYEFINIKELDKHLEEAINIMNPIDYHSEFRFFRDQYKNWDKSRYLELFQLISSSLGYEHDRNFYRLYFPFTSSGDTSKKENQEVVQFIQSVGFDIVDYSNGIIQKKDAKGKVVQNKIQSVLSKYKKPELEKAFVKDQKESKSNEYSIVISRHAYDILGMTTGRDWPSCMKIGGHSNHCTYLPMDIKQGSIVAYLINSNDKNITNPLGRLTIRPYINSQGDVAFGNANKVYHTKLDTNMANKFMQELGTQLSSINKLQGIEGVFFVKPDLYPEGDKTKITFKTEEDRKLYELIIKYPSKVRYYPNIRDTILIAVIYHNPDIIKYIDNPSDDVQIAAVKQDAMVIGYIKNPSKNAQIAAVRKDVRAIEYIDDPSEEVQVAAVERTGNAIQYIKNPSEGVKLTAVREDGNAIQYIENPSEEVQLAAVGRTGNAIQYIKNPSEDVQLTAVNQEDGNAIQYIKNPSEDVQLTAVKLFPNTIQYIKNPSEDVQLTAVRKKGMIIRYIENPSEDVQMAAINQNGEAMQYIENPSEDVQMAAINKDGYTLWYIKNPSKKIIKLALTNDSSNLQYLPKKLCDYDLCKFAVLDRTSNLQFVPDNIKTELLDEIASDIVRKKGIMSYHFIPEYVWKEKPDLTKIAVEKILNAMQKDGYDDIDEYVMDDYPLKPYIRNYIKNREYE